MSTSGAGFVGYQVEDEDVTASLRHRFNQNFWVQAGIEAQTGDATDALGKVDYTLVGVPVSANFDTTDSKLDPTRGVRLNVSAVGFGTFLGSSLDLVQAKATRVRLLFARRRIPVSCWRGGSQSARWAARSSTRFQPTGAFMQAAAGRSAAMHMTSWARPFLGRRGRRAQPLRGVGGIASETDRYDRPRPIFRRRKRVRIELPELQ